jgi:hypothetical protein
VDVHRSLLPSSPCHVVAVVWACAMDSPLGVDADVCPQAVTPNTISTIIERMDASAPFQ